MRQMKQTYPLDNSGILHLATLRPGHSNLFRISVTLREAVRPELLQEAFRGVTPRFPTLVAGIRGGMLEYQVIPVDTAPAVRADRRPLAYMPPEEIEACAMRVLYDNAKVSVEFFHALTDGYGGFALVKALLAEYLRLAHGVDCPADRDILLPGQLVEGEETADSFLAHAGGRGIGFQRENVYLPGEDMPQSQTHTTTGIFPVGRLRAAARRHGVSLTTLLTTVMTQAVMELQARRQRLPRLKPVQVMVPVDLRRKFRSKTLRNFSLYAFACVRPEERLLPFTKLVRRIDAQLRKQFSREHLASMMATNTTLSRSLFIRPLPLKVKRALLRVGFRVVGERNSSLTVSNLGEARLPEELRPHIRRLEIFLSPRTRSPYNCGMVSYDGRLYISFTRSCPEPELEPIFIRRLCEMGCTPTLEVDGDPFDLGRFLRPAGGRINVCR